MSMTRENIKTEHKEIHSIESIDIVEKARIFATAAHGAINHLRRNYDKPYTVHLEDVYKTLKAAGADKPTQAGGWLHDILEDTQVSYALLKQEFGDEIANLVLEVTDVSTPGIGNRRDRKALDRAHAARASSRGQTIKYADILSNLSTIEELEPEFARIYLKEKYLAVQAMKNGDESLRTQVMNLIDQLAINLKIVLP
ncbi:HD domain-containing protein [Pseudomonas luteola]